MDVLSIRRGLGLFRHPRRTASRLARARDVLFFGPELSFAQDGEDRVIAALVEGTSAGYYVDIGAHHPTRYSNTAALYRADWHGIDVDARPGTARLFGHDRPRDMVLEVGVGPTPGTLPFFVFDDEVFNTLSIDWAKAHEANGHKITRTIDVPVMTLAELLSSSLPPGQKIDLMSVDVEGLDLEVLQSNDWDSFRPRILVVEDFSAPTLDRVGDSPIVQFLCGKGYHAVAKTTFSTFFRLPDE